MQSDDSMCQRSQNTYLRLASTILCHNFTSILVSPVKQHALHLACVLSYRYNIFMFVVTYDLFGAIFPVIRKVCYQKNETPKVVQSSFPRNHFFLPGRFVHLA